MSTPSAFAALRAKQQAEQAAADARSVAAHKIRLNEERVIYEAIAEALRPYAHTILDSLQVEVTLDPENKKVLVSVAGDHYLTFQPERHWGSCHCEGPCDCTQSTWLTLRVIQHRSTVWRTRYGQPESADDLHCYFPVSIDEVSKPEKFAEGMAKMMDEYWYTDLAKGKKRP